MKKKTTIKFPEKTKDYEKRHAQKSAPKKVAAPKSAPMQPQGQMAQGRPDTPLAATPEPQMMM